MKNYEDDDYEEDVADDFEQEDQDEDLKLEKLRQAMAKENAKA